MSTVFLQTPIKILSKSFNCHKNGVGKSVLKELDVNKIEIENLAALQIEKFPNSGLVKTNLGPREVGLLRLDTLHPVISGNKWFKLKYNLEAARKQGFDEVLSCGGIHSNHLHALASAGQYFGIKVRALVRGYSTLALTPTLLDCQRMGMVIEFVDKKTYQRRYDPIWCQQQADRNGSYWIPEGGNNALGQKGCEEIALKCEGFDEVWLSIGSGCTFSGIENALDDKVAITGVMAIKGGQALADTLLSEARIKARCKINTESHMGGFGHCPAELIQLIQRYDGLGLPLDPVYTGKLIMAFEHAWRTQALAENKRYLIIHSGGLQGRRGVKALSASLP